MTLEQQKKRIEFFTNRMKELCLSKGDDYAGQSDRLANFKDAGTISGSGAAQNCFNLMATKMARLKQLLSSGKTPNNESIQDSLIDLANYSFLLDSLLWEKDQEEAAFTFSEPIFTGTDGRNYTITNGNEATNKPL